MHTYNALKVIIEEPMYGHKHIYTVQLRCNIKLARKQFTCTRMELLVACALSSVRNSHKINSLSSEVVSDTVMHISLGYHVTDHHNVHRIVLGLVSRRQNICHRALIY